LRCSSLFHPSSMSRHLCPSVRTARSSLDRYKKELTSGKMDWTPVHRSEKFWRENVTQFEAREYQLLK